MRIMLIIHRPLSTRDYIGRLSLALVTCCLLSQCTARKLARPPQLSQNATSQLTESAESAESAEEALDRLNAFLDRA
jgi:hypothetical protein